MLYGLIIISSRAKSHPGVDEMHLQAAMMKNRVCVCGGGVYVALGVCSCTKHS